mmetsp:Transcript_34357/g.51231  ORF Transcript_34357/g.51231 Transcript_34357/m.51231 type:complete len:86 (-) Transcript_34357:15-272(-)
MDRIRGYQRDVPLTGKVRKDGGRSGTGRETLPPAVREWIDWRWRCVVERRLGFKSLDDMRSAWASELASRADVAGAAPRQEASGD